MNRGILLIAFKSKTYGKYAYNLAHSIKYYSNENIHLVCDQVAVADIDLSIFDSVTKSEFTDDYCLNKIGIFERSPFEKTLYLDVDSICIKDIITLFESLNGERVFIQSMGLGGKSDKINYNIWAENNHIWEHFKLKEDAKYCGLQTSIVYFEKSKELTKYLSKLKQNYENRLPKERYKIMWGKQNQHPDELYNSVTMAQLGIIPKDLRPVFFPDHIEKQQVIEGNHYLVSMYGASGLVRPYAHDMYDRYMHKILADKKLPHYYKSSKLYKNKFIGVK